MLLAAVSIGGAGPRLVEGAGSLARLGGVIGAAGRAIVAAFALHAVLALAFGRVDARVAEDLAQGRLRRLARAIHAIAAVWALPLALGLGGARGVSRAVSAASGGAVAAAAMAEKAGCSRRALCQGHHERAHHQRAVALDDCEPVIVARVPLHERTHKVVAVLARVLVQPVDVLEEPGTIVSALWRPHLAQQFAEFVTPIAEVADVVPLR